MNQFRRLFSSRATKPPPPPLVNPWSSFKGMTGNVSANISPSKIEAIRPLNELPVQSGIVGGNDMFWMSSPMMYECSTQRLNMLGRLISQLQLDAALLQMEMSPKGTAPMVLDLLLRMKKAVIDAGGKPSLWYVKEAVVGRGEYRKFIDIKGRFRSGVICKGHAQIKICLYRPDLCKVVDKLLKIKKIPREDRPIARKSYNYWSP